MRYPDDSQRASIVGRTGSGKTVAAAAILLHSNFNRKPYLVYDFKRDSLLAQIGELDGTEHIDTSFVPTKPGIYFVHPHPDDTESVERQMWAIWERENVGVFVDEGYMVCGPGRNNSAFRSLLTQGRSKKIPVITLSQRPVYLDRFVFSEADFFIVFSLTHSGDQKKVMEYVPADLTRPLPQYHSYYHDVAKAQTVVLKPFPSGDKLIAGFDRKLDAMRLKTRRRVAI